MERKNDDSFLHTNKVPSIINYKTLIRLIREQGPDPETEQGRLFSEDDIKLEEVKEIRIEFLNILKIDFLWPLTNLVKLSLVHNVIEDIENLDALVNLKELDLSFNYIKVMTNLDHLIELEILVLSGNQISQIENIDNLKKLTIFSIADNNIDTWDHVLYLRKFENLRSLNLKGNPCVEIENYKNYTIAFIPQIIYFSYVMITPEERQSALDFYRKEIAKIEAEEEEVRKALNKEEIYAKKVDNDVASFVEHLDGDEFFLSLFEHDEGGNVLKEVNDSTLSLFDDYKRNITELSNELYKFGIDKHNERLKEIEIFSEVVKKTMETVRDQAREMTDKIIQRRIEILEEFTQSMKKKSSIPSDNIATSLDDLTSLDLKDRIHKVQTFSEEFNKFLATMWSNLLYNEVVLHEQVEDLIQKFESNVSNMNDQFIVTVGSLFSKLQELANEYHDAISPIISQFINDIEDRSTISSELLAFCDSEDTLKSTLEASKNLHLEIINNRQASILMRLKNWFTQLIEKFSNEENSNHRRKILEVFHFLQFQREQLQSHLIIDDDCASDVVEVLENT